MEEVKKYLLYIGFDDAHLPELFNDDDKSYYTIPELMQAYTDHKLKLLGIPNVSQRSELLIAWEQYKKANWYESDAIDAEKLLMSQFLAIYSG